MESAISSPILRIEPTEAVEISRLRRATTSIEAIGEYRSSSTIFNTLTNSKSLETFDLGIKITTIPSLTDSTPSTWALDLLEAATSWKALARAWVTCSAVPWTAALETSNPTTSLTISTSRCMNPSKNKDSRMMSTWKNRRREGSVLRNWVFCHAANMRARMGSALFVFVKSRGVSSRHFWCASTPSTRSALQIGSKNQESAPFASSTSKGTSEESSEQWRRDKLHLLFSIIKLERPVEWQLSVS